MEALRPSEDMLAKAAQLWTMLDDMSENSPESYHKFMQEQLKEARHYYAPPEPYLCVRAHILEPTEKTLFVNLCRWNKVPAPQKPSDPVPLSCGKMEELSDTSELYNILDIAYNPSVLDSGKDDAAKRDWLICLSLKYIQEHYDITLSPSYSLAKFKLKGSMERLRQCLRGAMAPTALPKRNTEKEVTLNQPREITTTKDSSDLTLLLKPSPPSTKCLIEELASTEKPEEWGTPAYQITPRKDAKGKLLQLELEVELPGVCCVSECNLSVSKDDVLIECPEKYRLHLDLPAGVNEHMTTAKFYKQKHILHITMPSCQ